MHCAGNDKVEDTIFKLLTAFKIDKNLKMYIRTTRVYNRILKNFLREHS